MTAGAWARGVAVFVGGGGGGLAAPSVAGLASLGGGRLGILGGGCDVIFDAAGLLFSVDTVGLVARRRCFSLLFGFSVDFLSIFCQQVGFRLFFFGFF